MPHKTSLREFQSYLADRLQQAVAGCTTASWLGIESGGENWLVDLCDGGEIVPTPQISGVPLTRPWFAGVANVRGTLYAITDFSAFRGKAATPRNAHARLLLVGSRHGVNAGLLVGRTLGLKNPESFAEQAAGGRGPLWGTRRFADPQGRLWHKLDVRALLASPEFMNIAN
ncbi:chemotaxis protein CheW [Dechloromonas sp. ZY10]|uniref:chemotaxis protein CheW n=1 Tax=Dechloromonas aquae TaxID=2664436 RepID=UPI003529BC85